MSFVGLMIAAGFGLPFVLTLFADEPAALRRRKIRADRRRRLLLPDDVQ